MADAITIKWSQWSPVVGMMRCGFAEYSKLMEWMHELHKEASVLVKKQDKPHAIYGKTIYNSDDSIEEIRFYTETYLSDDELIELIEKEPRNAFYVAHKRG